jgi:cytochrome c oxidase cbb3-type subunit I/II
MIYNLWKTTALGKFIGDEAAEAAPLAKVYEPKPGMHWHHVIERRPVQFAMLAFIVVIIGGIIELVPTFMIKSNIPTISSVKPYTPLELEGRDLYIREGCNTCHSQMIRPFRSETERYGEYSKAGEFVYDHPFLWGSRRTGPDLARQGGKYPNAWQYNHLVDPRTMSPGSIMPPYPWLAENALDVSLTEKKISVMRKLGVPYAAGYETKALGDLQKQAAQIAADLNENGVPVNGDEEIIAMIAYLQRLGTDIRQKPAEENQKSN